MAANNRNRNKPEVYATAGDCPGHEAPADSALARAAALDFRTHRLQAPRVLSRRDAHEHLLDDPAIERIRRSHRLKGWQRDLAGGRTHPRALDGHLPTAQDHFAARRPGAAGRPLKLVRTPWPARCPA
jgi:hypothetical protein